MSARRGRLGGGAPAEDLAWSMVEAVLDGVQSAGVDAQVGALGEVLAQQPVGVLVGAALPGLAGWAK